MYVEYYMLCIVRLLLSVTFYIVHVIQYLAIIKDASKLFRGNKFPLKYPLNLIISQIKSCNKNVMVTMTCI